LPEFRAAINACAVSDEANRTCVHPRLGRPPRQAGLTVKTRSPICTRGRPAVPYVVARIPRCRPTARYWRVASLNHHSMKSD